VLGKILFGPTFYCILTPLFHLPPNHRTTATEKPEEFNYFPIATLSKQTQLYGKGKEAVAP